MANTGVNSSKYLVVFDGQSFNTLPSGPTGYPPMLMNYFPNVSWRNPSKSATEWDDLSRRASQEAWTWPSQVGFAILIMNGGTSDVSVGDSGQLIYDDQKAYALAARAAGYDRILTVTILPSTSFNGTMNTNRTTGNTKLLTNADGAFDGVADFAGDSRMQNPADTNYYSDGTHPAAPLGVGVEVELTLPFLRSWLT
jgi:hypothetical protein